MSSNETSNNIYSHNYEKIHLLPYGNGRSECDDLVRQV